MVSGQAEHRLDGHVLHVQGTTGGTSRALGVQRRRAERCLDPGLRMGGSLSAAGPGWL